MTEQLTLEDSGSDPPDACFYYGSCGNEAPANNIMCNECLGLARHKDKLGAERAGGLLEFTNLVYRFYDEPSEVMDALHEKGPEKFVNEISGWSQ